jgi:hypothetical protein
LIAKEKLFVTLSKDFMKSILHFLFIMLLQSGVSAQMVMNGGHVVIQNGAYIYLTDANPTGIVISNTSGGFVINDASSRLRWHIYSNYGSYTVPFYYLGSYLPLSFSTSLAQGGGYLDLGTYATPTWKNSDYLPPGVTNVDHSGADNSAHVVDRFWLIEARDYITKPTLSNLTFTYRDIEWNAAGNSINEPLLKAQRWNPALLRWSDMAPTGTANTSLNTVTLANVASGDLHPWWTLVDAAFPLPLQLLSFQARLADKKVKLDWSTSMEVNTKEFAVGRSSDGVNFKSIDTVAAAGNSSTVKNYSTLDLSPLQGVSYYRLKMIDVDGKFTYSAISMVIISGTEIIIYPNPVTDKIHVDLSGTKAHSFIIYGASGRAVKTGAISNAVFSIDLSHMAQGAYLLQIQTAIGVKNFSIIKN